MQPLDRFYSNQKIFDALDKLHIKPWHWISLSVLVAGADFISGPHIQFPILYFIPISCAAWSGKRKQAFVLAIVLPSIRLIYPLMWVLPWPTVDSMVNVAIRIAVFMSIVYLISLIKELRILRGFLHVCGYCGRIKEDDEKWISQQEYITQHSEAVFSHGICPDCVQKFMKP